MVDHFSMRLFLLWFIALLLTIGATASRSKNCQKLSQGCTIIDGNLIIGSSITAEDLKSLEVIKGRLTIEGVAQELLIFPQLHQILAKTAPALLIKNNPGLEIVEMPDLLTISTANGSYPVIELVNNPELNLTLSLYQYQLEHICKNRTTAPCYNPLKPLPARVYLLEGTWSFMGFVFSGVAGIFLTVIAGVTMTALKREQIAEMQQKEKKMIARVGHLEEEKKRLRGELQLVEEQLREQMMSHFHRNWKDSNGNVPHLEMLTRVRNPHIIRIPNY